MTLENLTEYIEGLLRSKPHLRDDDRRLVANVWHYELKHDNSISDFLTAYVMDKITSADTITRIRRKLQELKPDLRGTKWAERHEKEQKVINDLKKIA